MTLKKIGIVLLLIFSLFPIYKVNAQTTNTGFVPVNIWYSKDPFQEGDKIKIYTLVFNPDSRELSGTVFFFDDTTLLGKNDFAVSANATKAISISWIATAGDHTIFAKIENAKFLISKGNYEETYLTLNETQKSSRTVAKKITTSDKTTTPSQTNDNGSSIVSDIKNTINEKTPDFISKPVVSAASGLEGIRINESIASDRKKKEINNEIEALNNTKTKDNSKTDNGVFLKPFKYVELFLLSLSSFIFSNKIVFYVILVILVFFILRFIWKKIF